MDKLKALFTGAGWAIFLILLFANKSFAQQGYVNLKVSIGKVYSGAWDNDSEVRHRMRFKVRYNGLPYGEEFCYQNTTNERHTWWYWGKTLLEEKQLTNVPKEVEVWFLGFEDDGTKEDCDYDSNDSHKSEGTFKYTINFEANRGKMYTMELPEYYKAQVIIQYDIPTPAPISKMSSKNDGVEESNFCLGENIFLETPNYIITDEARYLEKDKFDYVWEYSFKDKDQHIYAPKITSNGKTCVGASLGCLDQSYDPSCQTCEKVYVRTDFTWISLAGKTGADTDTAVVFKAFREDGREVRFRYRLRSKDNNMTGPPSAHRDAHVWDAPPVINFPLNRVYTKNFSETSEKIYDDSGSDIRINHVECQGDTSGTFTIKHITGTGKYYYNIRGPIDPNTLFPHIDANASTHSLNGEALPAPDKNNSATWLTFPDKRMENFTAEGFKAGTYVLVVENLDEVPPTGSDLMGGGSGRKCFTTRYITIKEPATPVTATAKVTSKFNEYDVSWRLGTDGTVELKPLGGIGPYTYFFGTNKGTLDQNQVQGATQTNLRAYAADGTTQIEYYYKVKDALGCEFEPKEPITLSAPEFIEITGQGYNIWSVMEDGTDLNIKCKDQTDTVFLTIQGGRQPYYVYRGSVAAENFLARSESADDFKAAVAVTVPGLGHGDHKLVVADHHYNNHKEYHEETTASLKEPTAITIADYKIVEPACFGQDTASLMVRPRGAIQEMDGPNGNLYTFKMQYKTKEAESFRDPEQWRNFIKEQSGDKINYTRLVSGWYKISITGEYDCSLKDTIFFIDQPKDIIPSFSDLRNVSCMGDPDGSIKVKINGGTFPYTLRLFNSDEDEVVEPVTDIEEGAILLLNSLTADNYSISVTDSRGCTMNPMNGKFSVRQPEEPLSLKIFSENLSCNEAGDGSVVLTASGGWEQGPYLYGNGPDDMAENNTKYYGLPPGSYTYYVKDMLGCVESASVVITEPEKLSIDLSSTEMVACHGDHSGGISLAIQGGTLPYKVSVNGGNTWQALRDDATSYSHSALARGSYSLLVQDAKGCRSNTIPVEITEPPLLREVAGTRLISKSTCGNKNGSVSFTFEGGTAPYTIQWNQGRESLKTEELPLAGTTELLNIASGAYELIITDAKGCTTGAIPLGVSDENGPDAAALSMKPVSCFGGKDGEAAISLSGGNGKLSISWSNGKTVPSITGLAKGEYLATVADENGCKTTVAFVIEQPKPMHIAFPDFQDPVCSGEANGYITAEVSGGNGDYKYFWSTGANNLKLSGLAAGAYILSVIDGKGCVQTDTLVLNDPAPVVPTLPGELVQLCYGQSFSLDAGYPGWTHVWESNFGLSSSEQLLDITLAGTYTVTVSSPDGCTGTKTVGVEYSDDVLNAEFLMSSSAEVGDTVVLVDISSPRPESATWEYSEAITRYKSHDVYEELIFREPGTYTISRNVQLAQCKDAVSKEIIIYEEGKGKSNGRLTKEGLIRELRVYPNPNSGIFKAAVSLAEMKNVSLELIDMEAKTSLSVRTASGKDSYEFDFNITDKKPGLYILYLRAGEETRTGKIIIY